MTSELVDVSAEQASLDTGVMSACQTISDSPQMDAGHVTAMAEDPKVSHATS